MKAKQKRKRMATNPNNKEDYVDLSSVNKPSKQSLENRSAQKTTPGPKPTRTGMSSKDTAGPGRDKYGRFSSGGGVRSIPKFSFKKYAPAIVLLSFIGGIFVLNSFAAPTADGLVGTWYKKCQNRNPDSGGLKYWTGRVNSGEDIYKILEAFKAAGGCTDPAGAKKAVDDFYKEKRSSNTPTQTNPSVNAQWVKDMFQKYLGRQPKQGDIDWWIERSKSYSTAELEAQIANTQEAKDYAAKTGTQKSGTASVNAQWVKDMFQKYLGRQPKQGDIDWWIERSKSYSTAELEAQIANTQEAKDYAAKNKSAQANPHICNTPYPTIKSGTKDNSANRTDKCVSAVQYNLKIADPGVSVTGTVDQTTVTAIKNYQRLFGVSQTGTLTPEQVKGIADVWGPFKTSSAEQEKNETEDEVTEITGTLDIAFISDGSAPSSTLQSKASELYAALAGIDPFSSIVSKIKIHIVPDSVVVNCTTQTIQSTNGPFNAFSCTGVDKVVANAGVPADEILVFSSNVDRAHANGLYAMLGTSGHNGSSFTMVHELSHLLGLADEYISYGDTGMPKYKEPTNHKQCITSGESSNMTSVLDSENWRTTPGPWSIWKDMSDVKWHKGCSANSWYRPSATSIMEASNLGAGFNSPSKSILRDYFSKL